MSRACKLYAFYLHDSLYTVIIHNWIHINRKLVPENSANSGSSVECLIFSLKKNIVWNTHENHPVIFKFSLQKSSHPSLK